MKIKGIINAGELNIRVGETDQEIAEDAFDFLCEMGAAEEFQDIFVLGEDDKIYAVRLGINLVEMKKEVVEDYFEDYLEDCFNENCDGYCYVGEDNSRVCLKCGNVVLAKDRHD